MDGFQPNLDRAKKTILENKDIFLKKNIKILQGHSKEVRKLASKSLASLNERRVSERCRRVMVQQALVLCEDYVYNRISETNNEDDVSDDKLSRIRYNKWRGKLPEVSLRIQELGCKLEESHPHLYTNLSSLLKMPLKSDVSVDKALTCIGDQLFSDNNITWYRIISFFAVTSSMAREALYNNNAHLLRCIFSTFSQIIDRHVVTWVWQHGGWAALVTSYESSADALKFLSVLAGFTTSICFLFSMPFSII